MLKNILDSIPGLIAVLAGAAIATISPIHHWYDFVALACGWLSSVALFGLLDRRKAKKCA